MLKKFLIERSLPGVGSSSAEAFQKMTSTSNDVLLNLDRDIQWKESYVTDDKIYCVYYARDEEIIREHARRGGFPVDKISEIRTVLDPTTEELHGYQSPQESILHAAGRSEGHARDIL